MENQAFGWASARSGSAPVTATLSNPHSSNGADTQRSQAVYYPTCSPIPAAALNTLVDVEPLDERQRPSAPGSDNRESPSEGLLRGFHAVRDQASKPDISAGHIAVTAIPGPKPVSGLANSLVGVGVPCSADQIVPPQSLRTAATVPDGELLRAELVRSQSSAQQ